MEPTTLLLTVDLQSVIHWSGSVVQCKAGNLVAAHSCVSEQGRLSDIIILDGSESQQVLNCQDLCRSAFSDLFRPALEKEFPEVLTQLSVGVVGGGSDCLGADDEFSRDHDWGVGRCRFLLPERIVKERGEAITEALVATVPDTYLGIAKDVLRPNAINVTTIDEIYLNLCSMTHPPSTMREWAGADESKLGMATYGLVIFDPTGELSDRKSAFERAYYPEDIRRWQMARVLRQIWQFGDYNGQRKVVGRPSSPTSTWMGLLCTTLPNSRVAVTVSGVGRDVRMHDPPPEYTLIVHSQLLQHARRCWVVDVTDRPDPP